MNRIMLTVAFLAALSVCGNSSVLAQDTSSPSADTVTRNADDLVDQQMALMQKHIESMRKQIIAANVTLTDTEATKFWPVYEKYSAELRNITETKTALIKEYSEVYGSLTDQEADSLICRWLDADIATLQLRRKYLPIFRKELGGRITATFFQVDHRINMMIDLQLTSQLPLVQSQDSSSAYLAPQAK